MKKILKNNFLLTGFLVLLMIFAPLVALANQPESDLSLDVSEEQDVLGNIVRVNNVINIDQAVNGDIFAIGNTINISGPVAGDIFAIGNSIRISGPVEGSVRVLGSTAEITNKVGKNFWAAGNIIYVGPEAEIGWDLWVGGASVDIRGNILGNVKVSGSTIILAGQVGKDAMFSVDDKGGIILLSSANVLGELSYKAYSQEVFSADQNANIAGSVNYLAKEKNYPKDWRTTIAQGYWFFLLISLFGLLVIGVIMVSLMPKVLIQTHDLMLKNPAAMIGKGFIYVFITPIIAFLALITLIGWPLALIIIVVYGISLYLAKIFVGFTVGLWLFNKINKDNYKGSLLWPLVVGILVVFVITIIPIVGWVARIILTLWALGAIYSFKQEILREFR